MQNSIDAKTIVIVAREMFASTGRYSFKLVENLQKIDLTNKYIILIKPSDLEKLQLTNPNFTKLACPHKEYTFAEQIGLKKQLESLKPDLVHFTMEQQPAFYSGKVVTTIHDLINTRTTNPSKNAAVFWFKQQVYKWLVRRVAKKSVRMIVPTEYVRKDLAKFASMQEADITVTLESADPIEEESLPLKELENKQFIMYVGRPSPHKNLPRLISAFKNLQEKNPELYLVLAGKKDGNYEFHEKRVINEGIKNVVFTDFIPDGSLRWLYENTSVYCFPSLAEGFGLPGLEAMIHGAPVASSNASCLPEVYGDAAIYFDPKNVVEMAEKISLLINDENLRHAQIEKGRKQAKKYSWRRMSEQTLEVYKNALNK